VAATLAAVGVTLLCTGLAVSAPVPTATAVDEIGAGSTVHAASLPTDSALQLQSERSGPPSAPPDSLPVTGPRTPVDHHDTTEVRDTVDGPVLPESDPVEVSIPSIGVRSALVDLGLDAAQAMEVPQDPARAGWFTRSAAPGALGPAVIAGHVTWNGVPGVFFRLDRLDAGDQVSVRRRDGSTAVFVVERVARYAKTRFPSRKVYGAIDHAGLRLITCGGAYDFAEHRYEDNVVVYARLVTSTSGLR
jgi:sortase (surface protein transpeptidase)